MNDTAVVIDAMTVYFAGDIRDIDHQILVEADFLVNAYEDGMTTSAIDSVRRKIFKTKTGKRYLDMIYGAY